jgi:hypothetical protein
MLEAIKALGRSIVARRINGHRTGIRFWPGLAVAAFMLALTGGSAHAQQQFLTFESVLSTPTAAWCIDISQGQFQAGNQLATQGCT